MAETKITAASLARQERFPINLLRQHVSYDPDEGSFKLLIATATRPIGTRIDRVSQSSGYRLIRTLGAEHLGQRVGWALQTGEWPHRLIDFVNGDRSDCRWPNLRLLADAPELDAAGLVAAISYDPGAGAFTWNRRPERPIAWNSKWAGKPAGCFDKDGYLCISVNGVYYKAHRLAVLYMTGEWPPADVDHADLDPGNNRWVNLRLATRTENNGNRAMSGRAASGLKGVYPSQSEGRWYSRIRCGDVSEYLGTFDTREEAHAAYVRAAERLFGEFARAG